ncbi:MAG TPA: nicotinate phosphoribosyltransferase [Rubricoccaceae bacterium]|nr:nicotinate phosphoribosyltransferase [Rubricoccaceae bacterium]
MPSPWITDERAALVTDLYQLTMLQAYRREGLDADATFDLFVRRLPPSRSYLVACGLDDTLRYLEAVRFTDDALDYLGTLGLFDAAFLDGLRGFRFTGTVRAVPEGTVVFANEPILEVTAPIAEAQLVETFLLNQVTFQTAIASKAARVVRAARGRPVAEFGMRRAHGTDAALKGARATWIAGCASTSDVEAGRVYGIPVSGTMAHSYIEAHDGEADAFRAFAALYPETVLLVDTYDTLRGVERVIALARELGDAFAVRTLRLDSGDLAALAKAARRMLDEAGLTGVGLFASSSLDEYAITELIEAGAPIDGFGVGTRLATSSDAPALDSVYKLAAYAGQPRMKLAEGKTTLPGAKQVWRRTGPDGRFSGDVIGTADEALEGTPLLVEVMRDGRRTDAGRDDLAAIRARAADQLARLPERLHALEPAEPPYPVEVSARLGALRDEVQAALRRQHALPGR